MKFSLTALTLFVASANAFTPASGPTSRYDSVERKNQHITNALKLIYTRFLVVKITRCFAGVYPSVRRNTSVSCRNTTMRIYFSISSNSTFTYQPFLSFFSTHPSPPPPSSSISHVLLRCFPVVSFPDHGNPCLLSILLR